MTPTTLFRSLALLAEDILKRKGSRTARRAELDRLQAERRAAHGPLALSPHGAKTYSQNDEDGMIAELFRRIGTTNKVFVEFGVGDGLENNTLALLFEGWRGLWLEGSARQTEKISRGFAPAIAAGKLRVVQALLTKDNLDGLIAANLPDKEIDLLSIDVDGNDLSLFEAIASVRARAVVIEYNAKFAPQTSYGMAYDAAHAWNEDDCFGASLALLEKRFAARGYALVGCDLTGTNAFFVRADLTAGKFLEPFTAATHHEPPRYHLSRLPSGHPPSYRTLATAIPL